MQACLSRSAALLRPCTPTQRISRVAQAFRSGAPANVRSQQQRRRQHLAAAAAGDAATPESLAAVKELDQLIDELMSKRSAQELAKTVAQNIMSFDQRFWLRLATRSDAASEEEDRQQLAALAKVVMQLVDSMVQRTNEQLNESTSLLQQILRAAADPQTGEWELPLPADKLAAMQAVMAANPEALDEGLLASCYSWMRKAAEDKMDGMVALLQKVLQLYACHQLGQPQGSGGGGSSSDALLDELLAADEGLWTRLIRANADTISEAAFMEALQRRMEGVVLGLPSGSYAQRVQAEYLKELEERARAAFADLA
ncbi:hypothetical protein C2E20_0188 [Micractinium conductrix]|uniref:Uncharacterized protein n=1 Tax=Micractinium conductrix TaxID=554055 RepID=A0A2P6VR62_9CHLO|nr:hypothetical protein C2E20_0188 [Micractinium conductrix]|eukprot:PSC76574.1 hypothetical protein C2E20_0188 [Micractinium conductrix]